MTDPWDERYTYLQIYHTNQPPLDPKTMRHEGFKPLIYGLEPLKMKETWVPMAFMYVNLTSSHRSVMGSQGGLVLASAFGCFTGFLDRILSGELCMECTLLGSSTTLDDGY